MSTHDDDLRVRLGRIRNRGSHYKGFFAEVRSAARNEGYRSRSPRVSRPNPSYFGRGRSAALRLRSGPGSEAAYAGGPSPHAGLPNSTRRATRSPVWLGPKPSTGALVRNAHSVPLNSHVEQPTQ